MAIYTPKFTQTGFSSGKNILASEHFQYIEGGATLDASKFGAGFVDVGTTIMRNTVTGLFEPYADDIDGDTQEPILPKNYDQFCILNVDWICDGLNNGIVGAFITRGSVYDAKLVGVTDTFRAATPLIRYVRHI